MSQDTPQRRTTDKPETVERVVALEVGVSHIKEMLTDHINDEATNVGILRDEMRISHTETSRAIFEVSHAMKQQATALTQLSDTVGQLAQRDVRISVIEERLNRVEPLAEANDKKLEETKDRIDFIYKGVAVAVPVIIAAWTLLTHFNII